MPKMIGNLAFRSRAGARRVLARPVAVALPVALAIALAVTSRLLAAAAPSTGAGDGAGGRAFRVPPAPALGPARQDPAPVATPDSATGSEPGSQVLLLGLAAPAVGHGDPAQRPADPPRPVPAATGPSCLSAAQRAELIAHLQRGGQKTALIVRGGKYGIHPRVVASLRRLAAAMDADPDVSEFLRATLGREYISDEEAARAVLESAGYRVVLLTSADHERAGRLHRFKADVLDVLARPETSVMIFYGHGYPDGMLLAGEREHSVPGPADIARRARGESTPSDYLGADEIRACRGSSRLDALILHGCQGGLEDYLALKGGLTGPTFGDCVKERTGFLAGWITYSVYVNPRTPAILEAFLCHAHAAATGGAGAPAGSRAGRSSRYFIRSSRDVGRKIAMIANLDDRQAIAGHAGSLARPVTLDDVDTDPDVHEHAAAEIAAVEPLRIGIDLAHALRHGRASLAADVSEFVTRYHGYAERHGLPLARDGRLAPGPFAEPSARDVDRQLAHHAPAILAIGLEAVAPGLVQSRDLRLRLPADAPDRLEAELDLDVTRGASLDELVGALRDAGEERAAQRIGTAIGGGLGPQLAGRLRSIVDELSRNLPATVLSLSIAITLEKVVRDGGNRCRAEVSRYTLAVGDVDPEKRGSRAAPYEVHVSQVALSRLVRAALVRAAGDELEIRQSIRPARFLPSFTVYGYVRLIAIGEVSRYDSVTLQIPLEWQLRVNWGPFGDGYARATTRATVRAEPAGDLRVKLTPALSMRLGSGWPAPESVKRPIAAALAARANRWLRDATAAGLDLASYLPAAVAPEIAGRVAVERITMDGDTLSVYIDHVR
jgi:hypothetical protein